MNEIVWGNEATWGGRMTQQQTEKARRVASEPWFRWLEGMQGTWADGHITERVEWIDDFGNAMDSIDAQFPTDAIPDLNDPGTVGFLFTWLVRRQPTHGWSIGLGPDVGWRATSCEYDIEGDTMGEAIANALLLVGGTP